MKLLLFISFMALAHATVYPMGTYIKSSLEINLDGNKLCALVVNDICLNIYCSKVVRSCIFFDECSYIENENGYLVDKRIYGCNIYNKNDIYNTKLLKNINKYNILKINV